MKFVDKDERLTYDSFSQSLYMDPSNKNTDWCLNELHHLNDQSLNYNPNYGDEVPFENLEKLIEIKALYRTERDVRHGHGKDLRIIKSEEIKRGNTTFKYTIDDIKELFEQLLTECSQIRYRVDYKIYTNAQTPIIFKLNNIANSVLNFIGRKEVFEQMNLHFDKKKCLIISSDFGGIGKTVTAEEFCLNKFGNNRWNVVHKFMCETEEKFNIELKRFAIQLYKAKTQEEVFHENAFQEMNNSQVLTEILKIIELARYQLQKFLFIFDNVESFDTIKVFTKCLINCANCKFIITTKAIVPIDIPETWAEIKILGFDVNEIKEFIRRNSERNFDDDQITDLIKTLCQNSNSNLGNKKILPKSLENAVKFLNDQVHKKFDYLLKYIENDESYLINFLKENSIEAFKLYLHIAVLDPDIISLNFVENLHSSINQGIILFLLNNFKGVFFSNHQILVLPFSNLRKSTINSDSSLQNYRLNFLEQKFLSKFYKKFSQNIFVKTRF